MTKRMVLFTLLIVLVSTVLSQKALVDYDIDLNYHKDSFLVKLHVNKKLRKRNNVYNFAATAPGTYQTMNVGRLVGDFRAFDREGRSLPVSKISVNQYKIGNIRSLSTISYTIAESFDTPLDTLPIYLMCGSTIRPEFAFVSPHTVAGFFSGMQQSPVRVQFNLPAEWATGTALKAESNMYYAESYDALVDAPILAGKLTTASLKIENTDVTVFSYAEKNKVIADSLINYMKPMLAGASAFLEGLPVDKYSFLYCFLSDPPGTTGAWEHSYSSDYVMQLPDSVTPGFYQQVTDIAAHEFFHIVTPLNIHSEVIRSFNFQQPTPSDHLWFYEGVTEWASLIQQLRSGNMNFSGGPGSYLAYALQYKILNYEQQYDKSWSLQKIARESFNRRGAAQYGNVYMKGAIVATYLDIYLLELSGGRYGLRELVIDLIEKYGRGKPFSEKHFLAEIVSMTYPQVKDFFDKYVVGNDPLPHAEFLSKIGISYEVKPSDEYPVIVLKQMELLTDSQRTIFDAWKRNVKAD